MLLHRLVVLLEVEADGVSLCKLAQADLSVRSDVLIAPGDVSCTRVSKLQCRFCATDDTLSSAPLYAIVSSKLGSVADRIY